VISESTYQFVQGAFRMKELAPLKLRGKKDPILAYVVSEALEQPTKLRYRSVGGLETNLVGRERHLEKLKEIYHRAQWTEQPLLAIVTGTIGIGKSRLMMEFVSHLAVKESQLTLISSRALQQASKVSFYLWRVLWANLFDLKEDDPLEVTQRKFVEGIQSLWGQRLGRVSVVETAHFIGDMLGFEWADSRYLAPVRQQPEQRLQRAFALHGELLSRAGANGPLVLMLDDLQWADTGSIKLLTYLIQNKSLPMFVLAGCRPEAFQRHYQLRDLGEIISLKPLPIDPELVRAAYPVLESVPLEVLSQLAQRSDGNPFYLEELVKNLVRYGEDDYSTASYAENLPQSLQLLLQARLDALTPEARGVALLAAVVGRVFWRGAVLSALVEASGTTTILEVSTLNMVETVQRAFLELTRAELAFPRAGGTFAGEREYIFKHSLLRDVAYSLLPRKYRGQCHLAVAQWLAKRASPELSVMVAEHYEKADAWVKARRYYLQAVEYARSQGNLKEAKSLEQHLEGLASDK
ncbi:MAG: AAA family ATPase, partial [Chloroflexota bacterium]|nr:AAA family ATPase [Chloroflexota bacterium]